MLFSFLVPVYNTEKYLKQCIDSLLVQKGAAFEIILLDDGSTDSSPQICDEYAALNSNIKVIHKENEGLLLTRRRGFREAAGEWFICIDSDDYVAPDLLENVVRTMETHDGCDMVMYNYQYVDNYGTSSSSRLTLKDGTVFCGKEKQQLYEMRLTSTGINNMWLHAISRDVVDIETDYSQSGIRNMCEDAIQVLPLYTNAKQTVYIDKPLYYYRKGDESITSRITRSHWQAIHRAFALEEPYVELWDVPERVKCKRYTKQMENICNCVRWIYTYRENVELSSVVEVIRTLKRESMFQKCMEHYDKKFAASPYSKVSLPIIAAALDREHFRFLNCFFIMESWLRRR